MDKIMEDDKYIYAKSRAEIINLLKLYKRSKFGSNSKIYKYNGELLKVFNLAQSISYMNNMERFRALNPKTMSTANKFLFINEQFYGYTMNKKPGIMFYLLNCNNLLSDFFKSLEPVKKDIELISKNNFFIRDLNVMNALYDEKNKKTNLVDCDSYEFEPNESIEMVNLTNNYVLYSFILSFLSNIYYMDDNTPGFYRYMKEMIIDKTYYDECIETFFHYFVSILENEVDEKIKTIRDFRKALILTYND